MFSPSLRSPRPPIHVHPSTFNSHTRTHLLFRQSTRFCWKAWSNKKKNITVGLIPCRMSRSIRSLNWTLLYASWGWLPQPLFAVSPGILCTHIKMQLHFSVCIFLVWTWPPPPPPHTHTHTLPTCRECILVFQGPWWASWQQYSPWAFQRSSIKLVKILFAWGKSVYVPSTSNKLIVQSPE